MIRKSGAHEGVGVAAGNGECQSTDPPLALRTTGGKPGTPSQLPEDVNSGDHVLRVLDQNVPCLSDMASRL